MKLSTYRKYGFSLALTLLAATACEVTDTAPADRIPEELAFTDASRVQANVVGAYEAAQRGFYGGLVDRGYPFGAASTEQGDMKGEDMYNDQAFYEITYINGWTTSTPNNNGMWISLYRLINRVNIVLEGVSKAKETGIITAAVADGYTGEMLFLRGLAHHELLIHFSRPYSDDPSKPGVPYRTFGVDDPSEEAAALAVGRGTVAEGYAKILADLDQAETLLGTTGGPYRATKGVAVALKTRVKLHMEDWGGVLTEYAKISGTYALTASPDGPFASATTTESVFSLQNSSISNAGVNGALVNMYGNPALGGRGLVKISPVIWKAAFWLADDKRRTLLTTSNSAGIYTHKYRSYGVFDGPTPLIRFAEVVLNAAEAQARQGGLDNAITLLNSVRDRAKPASAPSHDLTTLVDQAGVLQAIFDERRVEFLGEGRRWSDIHRLSGEGLLTGIPAKVQSRSVTSVNQYGTSGTVTLGHQLNYSSTTFIWPIPLDEILNNPTLAQEQNEGY